MKYRVLIEGDGDVIHTEATGKLFDIIAALECAKHEFLMKGYEEEVEPVPAEPSPAAGE